MILSSIILDFFLLLSVVGSTYAQTPHPPAGWEYVCDLDSLDIADIHASGDTIFIRAYDAHQAVKQLIRVASFDGGKKWDSMPVPASFNISHEGFFPREAIAWYQGVADSSLRFYTTRDWKEIDSVVIGKDTTAGLGGTDKFLIDPRDAKHWLYVGTEQISIYKASRLFQSFDGGHNWQVVNLPSIQADKITLEVVFDIRRTGIWYVHMIAQYNIPPPDDTAYVFRTTDNGQTFTEVNQWGVYAGIGSYGEMTSWLTNNITREENTVDGPIVGIDSSGTHVSSNWLSLFHPTFPTTNYSSGYYRTLSKDHKAIWSPSQDNPTNFQILYNDPLNQSIVEYEAKWDVATDIPSTIQSWVYHTTNDWKSYDVIWGNIPNFWVDQSFLDQKNNILYAQVEYYLDSNVTENPRYFKSFLYKYQLTYSGVHRDESIPDPELLSYPMPSNGIISVILPKGTNSISSVSLFSIEGEEVIHSSHDFSFSQSILQYAVPESISSGFYFLKIVTDKAIYNVKTVLQW